MSDEQRKQFEDQARRVGRKTLPPEWRAEILETAVGGSAAQGAGWEEVVEIVEPDGERSPGTWEKRVRKAERRAVWSMAACLVLTLILIALVFRPKSISRGIRNSVFSEPAQNFRGSDWREVGERRINESASAPRVVTGPVAAPVSSPSLPNEGFVGGVAGRGDVKSLSSRRSDATKENSSGGVFASNSGTDGSISLERLAARRGVSVSDSSRTGGVSGEELTRGRAVREEFEAQNSLSLPLPGGGDDSLAAIIPMNRGGEAMLVEGDVLDPADAEPLAETAPARTRSAGKKRPFVVPQLASNNVTEEVRYSIDPDDDVGRAETTREIGVTMAVTPSLLPDGTIRMKMRPRSAQVVEEVVGQSGTRYREVSESMLEKVADIPPGHSLVLAGFYGETRKKDHNKVPVLGDVPQIGMLFKSEETAREDPSLLFVVTPKSTTNQSDGSKQVVVETKVLKVNDGGAERNGANWQASMGTTGMPARKIGELNELIGLNGPDAGGTMAASDGTIVLSPEQLNGVLKALAQGGLVRQLSNPTVVTEEEELATISLIDRVPIITTTVNQDALPEPAPPEPGPEPLPEEPEKDAKDEPWSTFSLNVSDVSFKLAQATLARGEWPARGQIRVEEFVNAFDYGDRAPSQEEKVACHLGQASHPFMQQRNLLRVSMKTAALGRAATTPLRLTVLLDNSGSMERSDRADSVKRAFQLLAAQLNPEDQVTLIGFSRTPRLLADRLAGSRVGELANIVDSTPSAGGTNIEEALKLGLEKAREQMVPGAQSRIILLTDGAVNLGNAQPDDLAMLVAQMRGSGIAFDACGVGADGYNDAVLEALTRKGDGRYYFLDRPEDADDGFAKQIAGALRPAARNVKVQVEFNPERVGRYKLYGFNKHRLDKEDFRDDSVDAAEMAAAEAGNAVYQFEVRPEGSGDIGTISVRFQDTQTGEMVERQWSIPYVARIPRLEDSAPSLRLASGAALLGEKLKGTTIGAAVEMDRLGALISGLPAAFPADQRVAALQDMLNKARELSGE